jgi:hypothetical protein
MTRGVCPCVLFKVIAKAGRTGNCRRLRSINFLRIWIGGKRHPYDEYLLSLGSPALSLGVDHIGRKVEHRQNRPVSAPTQRACLCCAVA